MNKSYFNEIKSGGCSPLNLSEHIKFLPENCRDKFSHHRMISLHLQPQIGMRTIQNSHKLKNYSLLKNFKGRMKTENHSSITSPKSPTMKSIVLTEIYSSKHLFRGNHNISKLDSLGTIKFSRLYKKPRHSSIEPKLRTNSIKKYIINKGIINPNIHDVISNKNTKTNEFQALLQKGINMLNRKNTSQAIKYLSDAINLFPNIPEPYFHRGIAYFEDNMTSKALQDLEKIVEEFPNYNKVVYLYLSMIYEKVSDRNSALYSVFIIKLIVKQITNP